MAGLITVRLQRNDAQPWGFRLQGGKDFGTPLLIQKVNGGSLAEKAGLQVADAVIKVNGQEVYNLRHKDAQDSIVRAGNSMEIVVSRSPGGTWKPNVTPVGNIPSPSPVGGAPAPVTKTSLAYKGPPAPAIPGYNTPAKPFSPQLNGVGADPASIKSIASKQYNNPVGLYSDQTIAETLSAQAEVLAGGVLGVNFMKNEKTKFDASHSEVLKLVQEIDAEPRTPEPVDTPVSPGGGVVVPPPVSFAGVKHVAAPETKPPSTTNPQAPLQPGQNICADCERLIVGVFVRIKDKNLHVDCFKCATCGTSLKNVGYYNINNKLYCDVHAKLVARANPPAPNLDPVVIPPGGPIPSGAVPASLASGGPASPQPGTMAPLPFHPPPSNAAPPKPFGAPPPPAPFSAPAAPPPFAAPAAPPAFSAPSQPAKPFSSVQFNPPSAPAPAPFSAPAPAPFASAPAPPSSFPKTLPGQSESSHSTSHSYAETMKGQVGEIEDISCCQDKSKRMSVCSSEVCGLSEKRSAIKAMAPLLEDPVRASPVPFSKGDVVSESFGTTGQETIRQSENFETSEQGNVHITRKTKVEESFVRSQKMYTAEISSSQSAVQVRAASPELEQIMTRKQIYQSYDSSRLTPQLKKPQPERCLTPEVENLMEKPHGTWSPMPPACMVRPISPHAIISYPPDMPSMHPAIHQPRTATPEQFQEARETVERFVDHSKHVHESHAVTGGRTTQSYLQQSLTQQQQQYTPRYDMSESFSAYNVRGNGYGNGNQANPSDPGNQNGHNFGNQHNRGNNGNPGNAANGNPGNHNGNGNPGNHNGNPGNHNGNGNPGNHSGNGNPGNHNGNGNPGNHNGNGNPGNSNGNGNPGRKDSGNSGNGNKPDEDNPTVTEPDEEKYSRKSSGQSQKSRKSEEESSRRVFTDFGGPQVMRSLNVESTTEGGVEKTSVTKSEQMEYASCEFESTRKSTITHDSGASEQGKSASAEPRKQSYPTFSATEASADEEETITKSQVEQIIKQELNKVFHMAQSMDKTNLNEMYEQQKAQQSSQTASRVNLASTAEHSSQKVGQIISSSQFSEKKSYSGEAITKTGKLTSGLTIAPDRTFTPQPLESNYPLTYQKIPQDFPPARIPPGEAMPECKPGYIPVTGSRDSPMLQALTIASDRPYSPLPSATTAETPSFITLPKSQGSSMLEALTYAPSTPFAFGESNLVTEESTSLHRSSKSKHESVQKFAPRPSQGDFKSISTAEPDSCSKYASLGQSVERSTVKSYQPVADQLKSAFKSTSKVQSQVTESEMQQSVKSHQSALATSRIERPVTPSGLHPPDLLPYYQRNIGEIPLAHRSNSPVPHQIKAPELRPPRPESVPQPNMERRGSVKALSEAYSQQIEALNNNKYQPTPTDTSFSSVSYVSAGAYSGGSVTKTYSYEQDHKSIDVMGYHPSPLAGKRTPLAGERTIPKCSSPVLGKLDHTKQVFKPSVPAQQPSAYQSTVSDQANLRQAPPFFTQEKEKPQTPWVVVKDDKESTSAASFKLPLPPKPAPKLSFPTFPSVNKTPAFPEPPKPVLPDAGPGGAKGGATAGTTAPRRGRGVLNAAVGAGARVPLCGSCNNQIRGPFITALGKIWCPDHFVCVNAQCRRPLQDIGFVEEEKGLYCEYCFEQYLAPACNKCNAKIKGDCLNAIGKHFHPECFTCAYCGKLFGNSPFFLEDALPYCEADWNELFTTKCFSCGFPIEAGDRWVEALNNNYHSQCFSCTACKKNLEGQSFFAKGGRPFCKNHAR